MAEIGLIAAVQYPYGQNKIRRELTKRGVRGTCGNVSDTCKR